MNPDPGAGHVSITDDEPSPRAPFEPEGTPPRLAILIGPTNAGRVRAGLVDLIGRMRAAGVPVELIATAFCDEIDAALYTADPDAYYAFGAGALTPIEPLPAATMTRRRPAGNG